MCKTTLSGPSALWLFEDGLNTRQLVNAIIDFIMRSLFGKPTGKVESLSVFNEKIAKVKSEGLYKNGAVICNNLMALLRKRREVRDEINKVFSESGSGKFFSREKHILFDQLIEEIISPELMFSGVNTDIEIIHRRLQSLSVRLERFSINPGKDALKEKQLLPHLENLRQLAKKETELPAETLEMFEKYRQMVAEFRILIFSPEIKTRPPVSAKKLQQQWQAIVTQC